MSTIRAGARPVVGFLLLVLIDSIFWLSWSVDRLYRPAYRSLGIRMSPRILPAILAWATIAIGIEVFVLSTPGAMASARHRFWSGALFGFVLYATYDFTTAAVLPHFPAWLAVVDIVWGTLLCGLVALLTGFVKKK